MVEIKVHPFDTGSADIEVLKVSILKILLIFTGDLLWRQEKAGDDQAGRGIIERLAKLHDWTLDQTEG